MRRRKAAERKKESKQVQARAVCTNVVFMKKCMLVMVVSLLVKLMGMNVVSVC